MRSAVPLFCALASFALVSGFQSDAPITFDLKDPKGVTGMGIAIDGQLEPVRGFAGGISGSVTVDMKDPKKSSGKIVVESASTQLGSPNLTGAMHQSWCMDVAKYPTIEFEVTKVDKVKKGKDVEATAEISGNFTFHGVTKPLTATATVKYLAGKLKARGGVPKDGDLIQIHSKFSFNRLDFEVAPDLSTDLIGNKVDIDLAVTGVAIK